MDSLLGPGLDTIDRRTFFGFFEDLLPAVRRPDRRSDFGSPIE